MLGTYYYHEIIRKTIIGFGTLFNNIYVRHETQAGVKAQEMKVPLAYGPSQKFLARLEQQPDLNKMVAITLPRMSFEMTDIEYDSTRKSGITQTFKAIGKSKGDMKKVYMPVPYNIGFDLGIMCKLNDGWKYGSICSTICNASSFSFDITLNSNPRVYGTGI